MPTRRSPGWGRHLRPRHFRRIWRKGSCRAQNRFWKRSFAPKRAEEVDGTVAVSSRIDLEGRVFLVTGASRGIGQAAAWSLAREGAKVMAFDVLDGRDTTTAIERSGGEALAHQGSVTDPQSLEEAVADAVRRWGGIDGVVTAAGVVSRGDLSSTDLDEWRKVLDVNLVGTFNAVRAVYPYLEERRQGKVVCIGSVAGKVGGVISGPAYVASKGGIHALVKWLAKAAAPLGININGVAPGPVYTGMTEGQPYHDDMSPLGRLGQPADMAEAVVFLASPAANWITGHVLDVNGGMLMD